MGAYNNFAERLSRQIAARFQEIESIYNFDLGIETEVALCQMLTALLPDKYGVVRGFLVNRDGNIAGDDIIIYDRLNFPLLRQNPVNDFSLKVQVPVEAVYAYIECKNSITDQETLNKALDQVAKVKELLFTRYSQPNLAFETNGTVYDGKVRPDWPRREPEFLNQPFAMIFTRKGNANLSTKDTKGQYSPDLVVLGQSDIATQHANLGPDGIKSTLFFDHRSWIPLTIEHLKNKAYGIGIIMLVQALQIISLSNIDWYSILNAELSPFRDD